MEYERSLEAGDGLTATDNREIAAVVAHNHRHKKCPAIDKGEIGVRWHLEARLDGFADGFTRIVAAEELEEHRGRADHQPKYGEPQCRRMIQRRYAPVAFY